MRFSYGGWDCGRVFLFLSGRGFRMVLMVLWASRTKSCATQFLSLETPSVYHLSPFLVDATILVSCHSN